jgi:hypothetical protein
MEKSTSSRDHMYWKVIDLDTGKDIPRVTWANDETGEYEQIPIDDNGLLVRKIEDGERFVPRERKHGNIKLVDIREVM